MNNLRNSPYFIIIVLAAVLLIGLGIYGLLAQSSDLDTQVPPTSDLSQRFVCQGGKSIEADFGDRLVVLRLSDGREVTIEQGMSASGARYTNEDESFIFWNKGNTAFVEENGVQTYSACVIEGENQDGVPVSDSVGTSSETGVVDKPSDSSVFCTMDAKICPDGSAVGRVAPRCEFAPCPGN